MGRYTLFSKGLLLTNLFFALLLLITCILPYISLARFPIASLLSLTVPLLILANLFFLIFWAFRTRRAFVISLTALAAAYFFLGTFFKINYTAAVPEKKDFTIMSFNTRAFNKYNWIDNPALGDQIINFVSEKDPDVICFQEFEKDRATELRQYPYQYVQSMVPGERSSVKAIFSKYPIIEKGTLNSLNNYNNAIYADILYGKDTLRLYNVHMESLRITPDYHALTGEPSGRLFRRLGRSFSRQEQQAERLNLHISNSAHKNIVCGDFNNTQFSNVYHLVKGDRLQDTFEARGKGYGSTYNFNYFPARIDFILTDITYQVVTHEVFREALSDHFPIMASIHVPQQ